MQSQSFKGLCQLKVSNNVQTQFQKYKGHVNSISKVQRSYQLKVGKSAKVAPTQFQKCKGHANSRQKYKGQVFYAHYYLIVALIFALRNIVQTMIVYLAYGSRTVFQKGLSNERTTSARGIVQRLLELSVLPGAPPLAPTVSRARPSRYAIVTGVA